jgi:hypothetical protein
MAQSHGYHPLTFSALAATQPTMVDIVTKSNFYAMTLHTLIKAPPSGRRMGKESP